MVTANERQSLSAIWGQQSIADERQRIVVGTLDAIKVFEADSMTWETNHVAVVCEHRVSDSCPFYLAIAGWHVLYTKET